MILFVECSWWELQGYEPDYIQGTSSPVAHHSYKVYWNKAAAYKIGSELKGGQ